MSTNLRINPGEVYTVSVPVSEPTNSDNSARISRIDRDKKSPVFIQSLAETESFTFGPYINIVLFRIDTEGLVNIERVGTDFSVPVALKDVLQSEGEGAVSSVNGQTGDVVLNAASVGALPDDYEPPAPAWGDITDVPVAAAVADAADETEVLAQLNALLASLRTAGLLAT